MARPKIKNVYQGKSTPTVEYGGALVSADKIIEIFALKWRRPPAEVLDGAICTPENSWLFDPITREESKSDHVVTGQARVEIASKICQDCPVRLACLEDAIANNLTGVYGGVYRGSKLHMQYAERRRNNTITRRREKPIDASDVA